MQIYKVGEVGNNIEKENVKTGQIHFTRSGERKGRPLNEKRKVEHRKSEAGRE